MGHTILLLGGQITVGPGIDIYLLPKMVCIALGCWLILRRRPYRIGYRFGGELVRPLEAVLASAALSALASDSPLQSIMGHHNSPTAGVLGVLAMALCYHAGRAGRADRSPFSGPLVLGSLICVAVAIRQYLFVEGLPTGNRAYGTMGSPPFMGALLATTLPVVGPLWAQGVVLAGLCASKSRAAIAAGIAGLVLQYLPRRQALLAGVLALGAGLMLLPRVGGDIIRLQTWGVAWRAFLERPLLGWGPDCFTDAFMLLRDASWYPGKFGSAGMFVTDNAHCLPLHIAATQGIVGLAAWGWLLWRVGPLSHPPTAALLLTSLLSPIPFPAWCMAGYFWGHRETA